jgi:ubiquinone/menaquinone biosynthesis C-methylase UbiE
MKTNRNEEEVIRVYGKLAKSFHALRTTEHPEGWFFNEMLEMPTTLSLLGNLRGKKVLDLGCGSGLYVRELIRRGAKVKGIDVSEEMVKIAREENPSIEFKVGSSEKLPYKNQEFDVVLSALMMPYPSKWDKTLKEVNRVLKPDGLFTFSIRNPVTEVTGGHSRKGKYELGAIMDYFKEDLLKESWGDYFKSKEPLEIRWHHKTYGTIVRLLVKYGFMIMDYQDSKPLEKAKRAFPEYYKTAINSPIFCTWKTKKVGHRYK